MLGMFYVLPLSEEPGGKRGRGVVFAVFPSMCGGMGNRTEDELLRRREHVEGEGDFVLVVFLLEPADEGGGLVEEEGEEG